MPGGSPSEVIACTIAAFGCCGWDLRNRLNIRDAPCRYLRLDAARANAVRRSRLHLRIRLRKSSALARFAAQRPPLGTALARWDHVPALPEAVAPKGDRQLHRPGPTGVGARAPMPSPV